MRKVLREKNVKLLILFCFAAIIAVFAVLGGCSTDRNGSGATTMTETSEPNKTETGEKFVLDIGEGVYPVYYKNAASEVSESNGQTVNALLFGGNVSWRANGYNIQNSTDKTLNIGLVNAIRKSGTSCLRYPGGIEGDYSHWYEMIGDDRKLQIDPFSKDFPVYDSKAYQKYYPEFGYDEFIELCEELDVPAIIQLNAGNGTPEEAADLVAYAIEKGWTVSSFCFGNEIMAPSSGEDVYKTKEEYVALFEDFYALLVEKVGKEKAEEIELGVVGMPEGWELCNDPEWDSYVLSKLCDKIDFIDVHIAYGILSLIDEEYLPGIFAASSTKTAQCLETVKNEINEHCGKYADGITIQITEYSSGLFNEHANSVSGALYLARILNLFCYEPKISGAAYLPMINHPDSVQTVGYAPDSHTRSGDVYWNNCASYIFEWFSAQADRQVLPVTTKCGAIFSENLGWRPAYRADMIETSVYYDEKSGKGTLFLINASQNYSVKTDISLPFDSLVIEEVTELWHEDSLIDNSCDEPFNVVPKKYKTDSSLIYTADMELITKPLSVVKIDFHAE